MTRMLLVASYVCLVASGSAFAQSAPPAAAASPRPNSAEANALERRLTADRAFALSAAESGVSGVELGRLALKKASSADVQRYAQSVIDSVEKTNEELKPILKRQGIRLPEGIDSRHKVTSDWLAKLSGSEFDRGYMTASVAKSTNDVAFLHRASITSVDPDLKAWAAKMLRIVQEQQKTAKDLTAKLTPAQK